MPLFKRIFGQGKGKASNTLAALCIGDYSRISLPIEGKEAHQLQRLFGQEANAGEGSLRTGQLSQSCTKNNSVSSQASFKTLRHILQHFGGGAASASPPDGAEAEAQLQLTQFLKNLGGYSSVTFVTAGEDGMVARERVLAKLTKLFKHATAPVVFVSYAGPSDERGNWLLASQAIPGGSALIGAGTGGQAAAATAVAPVSGTGVLSFREISMLWQRYRKHSQRLVLLLDCANSGYWVSALRMLSKAEQLELSLGVQASDCSLPTMQELQLTYQPGIFIQFYLVNNKWRRDASRRNIAIGGGSGGVNNPQQQEQQQTGPASRSLHINANISGSNGGIMRGEQWPPGMIPSYYATWLNDNLVDYGIALKFFNTQVAPASPGAVATRGGDGRAFSTSSRQAGDSVLDPLFVASPLGLSTLPQCTWRANTGPLAAIDSCKSLGTASRHGDEATSPSSEAWISPRSLGTPVGGTGGVGRLLGSDQEVPEHSSPMERAGLRVAMALRATSLQESARRRFSSLFFDNIPTDGAGTPHGTALSPNTRTMQRVRLSTPQGELQGNTTSPPPCMPLRYPTLPGDESLCRVGQETDGSGTVVLQVGSHVMSAYTSGYGDYGGIGSSGGGGGSRLQNCISGAADGTSSQPILIPTSRQLQTAADNPLPLTACSPVVYPGELEAIVGSGSGNDTTHNNIVGGDVLIVHRSAPSDSVAMAWDRRSSHADRFLVGECIIGAASSFTNHGDKPGGFAKELYGALHVVATERRLQARRTPLGGDETLDSMMEDADLERRASMASLPSAMLPKNLPRVGSGPGDSIGSIGPSTMPTGAVVPSSSAAPNVSAQGASAVATSSPVLPTPRTSALLRMTSPGEASQERPSSTNQRRQASRFFLMSIASHASVEQLFMGQTPADIAAADDEGGCGGSGDANDMAGLSMTASYDGVGNDMAAEVERSSPMRGTLSDEQRYGKHASSATDGGGGVAKVIDLLMMQESSDLPDVDAAAARAAAAAGAAAAAAAGPAPTSLDWPDPADSTTPSQAFFLLPSGHNLHRFLVSGAGAAGGGSGSAIRSLIREHVSIADSMDLDSASQLPLCQRRPGRFEMAGSESSSFVFGDDQERFDMLRMLRAQDQPPQQQTQMENEQCQWLSGAAEGN